MCGSLVEKIGERVGPRSESACEPRAPELSLQFGRAAHSSSPLILACGTTVARALRPAAAAGSLEEREWRARKAAARGRARDGLAGRLGEAARGVRRIALFFFFC